MYYLKIPPWCRKLGNWTASVCPFDFISHWLVLLFRIRTTLSQHCADNIKSPKRIQSTHPLGLVCYLSWKLNHEANKWCWRVECTQAVQAELGDLWMICVGSALISHDNTGYMNLLQYYTPMSLISLSSGTIRCTENQDSNPRMPSLLT